MRCLSCSCNFIELKNVRFSPLVKNEGVDIVVPCNVCKGCDTPQMDAKQMNMLRRKAADKYREKNSLLTSQQIIGYRKKLGMSQLVFAKFLNVGEASIKRWETYYIQDASQNDHIRLKCDESQVAEHYIDLQLRYAKPSVYTGGKRFSLDMIKNVDQHFLKSLPNCDSHLDVLHFYTDFFHFKRFNMGITGSQYTSLKCGPAPYQYKCICKMVGGSPKSRPAAVILDDSEKKTMDTICELYCTMGGETLSELAKKEKGYIATNGIDFISYKYSSDLLI